MFPYETTERFQRLRGYESRVISSQADIRFSTVGVLRKRVHWFHAPHLYDCTNGRRDITQEIPLSLCVISKLTKLLSFEGDTQIIKQTLFRSQSKQQPTVNPNDEAVDDRHLNE